MPKVSIIIPTRNSIDLVERCVTNLKESVGDIDYQLVVVTPKWKEEEEEKYKPYYNSLEERFGEDKVLIIMTQEPLPFSQSNNLAVEKCDGEYILFLNDDTVPQPGFLSEMFSCMERHKDAKIVGSRMYFVDSTKVQHIGCMIRPDGLPTHLNYGKEATDATVLSSLERERRCVAVTAACMLIKKDDFIAVDGFDSKYINGFEDTDLCFKIKQKFGEEGRIYYCPKSFLYHQEHGTIIWEDTEFQKDFQSNCKVFLNTWGKIMSTVNVI